MSPINFWLVDDEHEIAHALSNALPTIPAFSSMSWYHGCPEAMESLQCNTKHPDVILLDVHFPDHNGVDYVSGFLRTAPNTKILMSTVDGESEMVLRSLKLGASGYLLKPYRVVDLAKKCQSVLRGEMPIDERVAGYVVRHIRTNEKALERYGLTNMELQLLPLIAHGYIAAEIANNECISLYTVKAHLRNIHKKLQTHTHAQLVAKLHKERLV